MKWYCLGIHYDRGWLSWASSKQPSRDLPEGPFNCSWLIKGAFSLTYHDKRMRSTVSKSKTGHSLESYVPAVDLGRHLVEARLLLGSFHRNQKPLHIRRHIHTRGRDDFPLGMAGLHVSSSSLAPLQRKGEPSELRLHKKGGSLVYWQKAQALLLDSPGFQS